MDDLELVWDIGPRQTMRKVLSRSQERYRNEKYVACGIGYVREGPTGSALPVGQAVVFLAPCHPRLAERICLPATLLKPVESGRFIVFAWPRNTLPLRTERWPGGRLLVEVHPRLASLLRRWPFTLCV